MTINAGLAEELTAHYLRLAGEDSEYHGDDSVGAAAIPSFTDHIQMSEQIENGAELAFDVGVIVGTAAGIAATTLAPEAAIGSIKERIGVLRDMFKSFLDDAPRRLA